MTPASSILGSPSIEATGGVKSGRRKSARLAPALIPAPDLPKADSIKAGISGTLLAVDLDTSTLTRDYSSIPSTNVARKGWWSCSFCLDNCADFKLQMIPRLL